VYINNKKKEKQDKQE